jgi:hypothetical protein
MTRRVAELYQASLYVRVNKSDLVLEFEPQAENKRYKCKVVEWAEGQLDIIERRLIQYRMPLTHEGVESYFWVRTTDLLRAIGLVVEAFRGIYVFEVEFWYDTSTDEPKALEFRLADLSPATHDRVEIECTNWGVAGDSEENRDAFDTILKESGLCIPETVLHDETRFYAGLAKQATRRPLESFSTLVNLHLALADSPWSQTA